MTREDIISIAREVWGDGSGKPWSESALLHLERFGELLEAKVRADEREACAKVCEDIEEAYQRQESMRHPALRTDAETGSGECADAIRARGEK
jgi:hypothetical protein